LKFEAFLELGVWCLVFGVLPTCRGLLGKRPNIHDSAPEQIAMSTAIKLSSPATRQFWEIPVLFEDEHLLALDKPADLPVTQELRHPERPSLVPLLRAGITEGKPWARERNLAYLTAAHRMDAEISGVLLLARSKAALVALLNWFGSGKPGRKFVVLVRGTPAQEQLDMEAKLSPHHLRRDIMRVDSRHGKRSRTVGRVLEKFAGYTLMECDTLTDRLHQVRVHLRAAGLPVVGDALYSGRPLLLSRLKPGFRLKPNHTERPLLSSPALHGAELTLPHPVTGETISLKAPWPKDLNVALKYLRKYAAEGPQSAEAEAETGE
jgi:23S rRNA pseudouridine1911/1915/1917 synthase